MKVACLTSFVPRGENVNGPSGLLYQTIRFRPTDVKLTVFVFGQENDDFRDLPEIVELTASGVTFVRNLRKFGHVRRPFYWPKGARNIACFEIPDIDAFDAVWAYPYWFAPFVRNCGKSMLISGMDCASLLYWRKLKWADVRNPKQYLRTTVGLLANVLFELAYLRNCHVHVVGAADARLLQWATARPKFIPHPFLAYPKTPSAPRPEDRPLTFLVSNAGDPIYGSRLFLYWLRDLYGATKNEPSIRLLIHKAAPDAAHAIGELSALNSNVVVEDIAWVDDYSAMLREVDIQLFPLDIGAGTKTSVLTALQHGVRAVCTLVAAENVQANRFLFVVPGRSRDFRDSLHRAITSVREGVSQLEPNELADHLPETCSAIFWNHLKNAT